MPAAGSSGVDHEQISDMLFFDQMGENALGQWRAADISHANKKDGCAFHRSYKAKL
ncbi:hypothetical protein [Agrobacterium rosae]|uniref:Uncharacterized protein n=2 Tax=Agrobacterium rosae TaxID=1972867 RepID=A0AAW9FDZ3_9HYPH|nr:hypothetical protein [Agrobacterium rosae]MDX8304847.1 hypothetical protein [Agrobacterium rosae]